VQSLTTCQELFSKLRFSYLEQVTKEKFIRAIVGDPPLVVEHQENVELEETLAVTKAALKAQKTEVAELVTELEKQGRELARKYESIQLQTTQLRELPERIEGLLASVKELSATQAPGSNPTLNMPLVKTLALVEEREKERAELDRQLEQLQFMVPRKTKELERLNAELQLLEVKRLGSTAAANEAKRRKEEALGGVGDDLEERGRWWRGVESGLKGMLGVET
jgi:chromosome segregation ATPase